MTKQEVLNYLDNVLHPIVSPDNWNVYSELHDMIEELPSTEPVRQGKWMKCDEDKWEHIYALRCSECHGGYHLSHETTTAWNYCPECGARMDEE